MSNLTLFAAQIVYLRGKFFREKRDRKDGKTYLPEKKMNTQKRQDTLRAMVESAIMVAFAVVLGLLKLMEMPYGGSITFASMLPIAMVAYRHGVKVGFAAGLCRGVIETLLGLHTVSYVTGWVSVLAVILLDYVIAFAMMGVVGAFRGRFHDQTAELLTGCLVGAALRYLCHVISGATVWAGLSIPTTAVLAGSLAYNATYMVPETAVLLLVALYLSEVLDLKRKIPVRIKRTELDRTPFLLSAAAGLFLLGAAIFDIVHIFSRIQGEGGFDFSAVQSLNLVALLTVNVGAMLCATALFVSARVVSRKNANKE